MHEDKNLSEKTYMKVRLFRLAQEQWNLNFKQCSDLFNQYHLYDVIDDLYEEFHVQGDNVNLDELQEIIEKQGGTI